MFQPNEVPSFSTKSTERLLTSEEAERLLLIGEESGAAYSWPGPTNMIRLAEAVNNRNLFVEFEDGLRYYISYNDRKKHVFVRPAESDKHTPCGYYSYDRLKAELG